MPPEPDLSKKTLVLSCGNPARGDDGIGAVFVDELLKLELPNIDARHDYQFRVEDAMEVGRYDQVLFVDADAQLTRPYKLSQLDIDVEPLSLDTHHTSPHAIMELARSLFGAKTRAWLLGIRGYDFTPYKETVDKRAAYNIELARDQLFGQSQN